MFDFFIISLVAVAYGVIIGALPVIGATTGLVIFSPYTRYFLDKPYLGVLFFSIVIASSTIADSFSSILIGIPGSNSASASMLDGFPLTRMGKASYALSAALITSIINGLIWIMITFLFLPYYGKAIMYIGIPELWGVTVFALSTVGFLSSSKTIRSILSVFIGIFIGLIGSWSTGDPRFTFGWKYLNDGVQIIPLIVGLFIIPELILHIKQKHEYGNVNFDHCKEQIFEGIRDSFKYFNVGLKGGLIGAIIGILPGLGGAIADWISYSFVVASNPNEVFGNGNIKGVIGCEGANNSQKATSLMPTILFGIPGAPFAAVLIGQLSLLGFEMGTFASINDKMFVSSLGIGFFIGTFIIGLLMLPLIPYISLIVKIPKFVYIPVVVACVFWASVQYTGGIEDYIILFLFCIIGMILKVNGFSRISILIGFMLAPRIEQLSIQLFTIYKLDKLLVRPGFVITIILSILVVYWGYKKQRNLDF